MNQLLFQTAPMANPTPAKTLIIVAPELLQALPPEELAGGGVAGAGGQSI